MLDLVAAAVAGLLVLVGVAIIIGPRLPRRLRLPGGLRRLRPRRDPDLAVPKPAVGGFHDLHPTSQKVLVTASRIYSLLRAHNLEVEARELRGASQRLRSEEANGLYAMQVALKRLRATRTGSPSDDRRLQQLCGELGRSVRDRAEQLELLPFV